MKKVVQRVSETDASAYAQNNTIEHSLSPAPNNCVSVPTDIGRLGMSFKNRNIAENFYDLDFPLKRFWLIPMFIAGGRAYCSRRTNWYNGSEWMNPAFTAALTMTIPSRGMKRWRIAMIPAIRDSGTADDPFKPEVQHPVYSTKSEIKQNQKTGWTITAVRLVFNHL